ncbi:hypothetical protein [Microtetraspora niveoalba]|uniref:hypothetical protein n=1 Tax=Microtetraspora niveoalba TaxID=46175 RepID=UPI000AB1EE00|nr:hypothetical protein [Microtetraspora niveoalba]
MTAAMVETVLSEAGITLPSPVPPPRRIEVRRLRAIGTKNDGTSFSIDQTLEPGVWAIMHPKNLVGKTSTLEFLVWALRGRPRELGADVKSWVRRIAVDVVVSGQAVRVVLDQDTSQEPGQLGCRILSAGSAEELSTDVNTNLRPLAQADGEPQVAGLIGTFMMEALGLGYTSIWNPRGGMDGEGAAQNHGWPAYFGACYLNRGGDKLLLGDIKEVPSLPAKLLDLFIGIPYASVLTHLSTTQRRFMKETRQAAHRADQDRAARRNEREQWQRELDEVRQQLDEAHRAADPGAAETMAAVDAALDVLRTARQAFADAEDMHRSTEQACLIAEQQVMDAKETWQARRVLGLLSPTCCPRCEEPIEQARHVTERQNASCAVCTRPLPPVSAEFAEARIAELGQELAGQQEVRQQASDRLAVLGEALQEAHRRHEEARARLEEIQVAPTYQALRDLEIRAARLEGQLQATGTAGNTSPSGAPGTTEQVVAAVLEVLNAVAKEAADHLFPALNRQIVTLARDFGVPNLDSVDLKRNGHLNAKKGGKSTSFDGFQPGERLRVRIAMVIAMLRVSTQRGLPAHPGLLLIDAIGSEEVTTPDATKLISELEKLSRELPGLQIILTTAKPEYVRDALPRERIITGDRNYMF